MEEVEAQMEELRQSIHSAQPKEQGPPDEVSPPDDSSPPDEPSRLNEQHPKLSKRGKKYGGEDNLVEERKFLKKAKGMQRLEYISALSDRVDDTSNLTEGARNLVYTAVAPILKCLEMHHDSDINSCRNGL
jgi:hypothetical protein